MSTIRDQVVGGYRPLIPPRAITVPSRPDSGPAGEAVACVNAGRGGAGSPGPSSLRLRGGEG